MAFFAHFSRIAVPSLFFNIGISFWRLLIAYLIAAFLGWLLAVSFYRGRRANVALPVFDVLQSFPTFAALPLAVHFWGQSDSTTIFFLVITIVWPIFFSILSSLKLIKHEWEEAVQVMDLRGIDYLRHYLIPVSVPGLITGSIVGLGEGWEALVATEMLVEMKTGLGPFFQAWSHDVRITTFGILGFLLLIFVMNKLIWIPLLEWSHHRLED